MFNFTGVPLNLQNKLMNVNIMFKDFEPLSTNSNLTSSVLTMMRRLKQMDTGPLFGWPGAGSSSVSMLQMNYMKRVGFVHQLIIQIYLSKSLHYFSYFSFKTVWSNIEINRKPYKMI